MHEATDIAARNAVKMKNVFVILRILKTSVKKSFKGMKISCVHRMRREIILLFLDF